MQASKPSLLCQDLHTLATELNKMTPYVMFFKVSLDQGESLVHF